VLNIGGNWNFVGQEQINGETYKVFRKNNVFVKVSDLAQLVRTAPYGINFANEPGPGLGPDWQTTQGAFVVNGAGAVATARSTAFVQLPVLENVRATATVDVRQPGSSLKLAGLILQAGNDDFYRIYVRANPKGTTRLEIQRSVGGGPAVDVFSGAVGDRRGELQVDLYGDQLVVRFNDKLATKLSVAVGPVKVGMFAERGVVQKVAFSEILFQDGFNRGPASDLGADWVQASGQFRIDAKSRAVADERSVAYVKDLKTLETTIEAYAAVDASNPLSRAGVIVRDQVGQTFRALLASEAGGKVFALIQREFGGATTTLGSVQVSDATGLLRFDLGDQLKLRLNGQTLLTVDGAQWQGGDAGVFARSGRIESFNVLDRTGGDVFI
jgi:hypothetical protein